MAEHTKTPMAGHFGGATMRISRRIKAITVFASVGLVAGGCLSAKESSSDTGKNADVKNATLSISANAISGGKNSEEADWITKYVIPEFVKQHKAKGVTAGPSTTSART